MHTYVQVHQSNLAPMRNKIIISQNIENKQYTIFQIPFVVCTVSKKIVP